jgi:putative tryptophan/tyrosine transport system substrate-binding protein
MSISGSFFPIEHCNFAEHFSWLQYRQDDLPALLGRFTYTSGGVGARHIGKVGARRLRFPSCSSIPVTPSVSGLVDNLARPSGNVTGIANYVRELAAKRLDMIGEIVPSAPRIAMLFNPSNPISVETFRETDAAASARRVISQEKIR